MSSIHPGRSVLVLLALVCLLGAAACGGSGGGEEAQGESETLVVALPSEPENLNPIYDDNIYGGNQKFFNGLLRYDQDLSAVPDLAAEMPETSSDGRTVTVRLRDGVQFHDGEPFTAEDVVFTYESIIDPAVGSAHSSLLSSLQEVEAVDERTVRFSLNRPDPAFMDKLQIGIVPRHLLESEEDLNTAAFNKEPVGTGPYVFEEWRAGERIAMTSNPDYFDGPVNIPRVVFTFVTDENARAAMLENGSIDGAGLVPKLAPRFRDNADYRVLEVPSADARVMSLPNENPVLDDPAVRRALSLAIDREAMVEGVLAGAGEPAYGPVMPGHWAYDPAAEVPHDPAEARTQLEEAGWQDTDGDEILDKDGEPLSFTLMYPADDSVRKDVALAASSDLSEVGVDAQVEGLGWEAIEPRAGQDPNVFGYGTPYDPDLELYSLFHSSGAEDDDPFTNTPLMRNPTMDAALDDARSTLDQDQRAQSYRELQQAYAEDSSWLFLVRLKHIVVMSNRVTGVEPQVAEPHAHGFSRGTSWNMEDRTLDG